VRTIDRIECEAFGLGAKQALRRGLIESEFAWTALVDGKPEAMFGVVTVSAIEGLGRPWFLGTDEVYRRGRDMLRIGEQAVAAMLDSSPHLANLVSAGNGRAIRLLERWGFTVEEESQLISGTPFRAFWIER
jgi:ribosomal protein S18 acetylase RimI-like enzyme